jgi:hypothetical protein
VTGKVSVLVPLSPSVIDGAGDGQRLGVVVGDGAGGGGAHGDIGDLGAVAPSTVPG